METPKQARERKTNELFSRAKVFWAFSDKQFQEGKEKTPLQEGDKYLSIGAGGYMPKSNYQILNDGMKEIAKEFKQAMKDKKAREEHIRYELYNHEATYTGDIESTMDALGDDFTVEEVQAIFKTLTR